MENNIIFSLPGNADAAALLAKKSGIELGVVLIRDFPDEETYIQVNSDVRNKTAYIVCTLFHPNTKTLPLMFLAELLKELGAKKIILIAPYLAYLRQDKCFHPGEAVTAKLFSHYLSNWLTGLITIDPHLHRIKQLSDVYSMPFIATLDASKIIADWINKNIPNPFIIGPDEESQQWVAEVAKGAKADYAIIKKVRHGDHDVSITLPDIQNRGDTPVIVDDIISTGASMLATIQQLSARGFKQPICIGVHALFDQATYDDLLTAGALKIITCNTIPHFTNEIDVTDLIANAMK